MLNWILIASLYLAGMGLMTLVGMVGSAGEAFRRWGESVSRREHAVSPLA